VSDDIHTVAGKRHFIRMLCNSIRDELLAKAAEMPEEWDGFELRELLADKFEHERMLKRSYGARSKRLKDYRSDCYARNL